MSPIVKVARKATVVSAQWLVWFYIAVVVTLSLFLAIREAVR